MICSYTHHNKQCQEDRIFHLDKCVFHADREQLSGQSFEGRYREQLEKKIKRHDYDFHGYHFAEAINVSGHDFDTIVWFDKATFWYGANFSNCHFRKARFSNAHFRSGANFDGAIFDPMNPHDREIIDKTTFESTIFGGESSFIAATFNEQYTLFSDSRFLASVRFNNAKFFGDKLDLTIKLRAASIDFTGCTFASKWSTHLRIYSYESSTIASVVYLNRATFISHNAELSFRGLNWRAKLSDLGIETGELVLYNCKLRELSISSVQIVGDLTIINPEVLEFRADKIHFDPNSRFHFQELNLPVERTVSDPAPQFYFTDIHFNPNRSYFDQITCSGLKNIPVDSVIQIKRCTLKDVVFTTCDMRLFDFESSALEEARYMRCEWPARRVNLLDSFPILDRFPKVKRIPIFKYTEYIQRHLLRKDFHGGAGFHSKQLSEEYRQMASSYDRAGEYNEAGYFYFNRWETIREDLKNWVRGFGRRHTLSKWLRLQLYTCYWVLAGYGEKPAWSFCWLILLNLFILPFVTLFFIGVILHGNTILFSFRFNPSSVLFTLDQWFRCSWMGIIQYSPIRTLVPNLQAAKIANVPLHNVIVVVCFLINSGLIALLGLGVQRHFKRF
jgi:uncharacterized protein YjbI with pentapeptide repeats